MHFLHWLLYKHNMKKKSRMQTFCAANDLQLDMPK